MTWDSIFQFRWHFVQMKSVALWSWCFRTKSSYNKNLHYCLERSGNKQIKVVVIFGMWPAWWINLDHGSVLQLSIFGGCLETIVEDPKICSDFLICKSQIQKIMLGNISSQSFDCHAHVQFSVPSQVSSLVGSVV